MDEQQLETLKYPIGRAQLPENILMLDIEGWIEDVLKAPGDLRQAIDGLNAIQLDTPYRPGGWSVRQVVHHLPDSHMNTYLNFRIGMTENAPVLKSTNVDAWARVADYATGDVEVSLKLFESVQERWSALMKTMDFEQFMRPVESPGRGARPLAVLLGIYAWHGKHHVAQIQALRQRMGW